MEKREIRKNYLLSPLKHWYILLSCLELSAVAQHSNTGEGHPCGGVPVVGGIALILAGISLDDLVVEPQVSDGHTVLCQCSGLVRADGGSGSQSLHSFQVLHQTVLAGHTLSSQGQTYLVKEKHLINKCRKTNLNG